MELFIGVLPFFLVGTSVFLLLIPLVSKGRDYSRIIEISSLMASGFASIISFFILVYVVENGVIAYYFGGFRAPFGVVYTVDLLGSLLGFQSMIVLFLTVLYSKWFIVSKWSYLYYSLLFLLSAGSIGCFYTGDIFNLFVSIELLSISAYGLVAFYRDKPKAITAALRYAMTGIVATSIYFLAVILIYSAFGSLNMADIALKLRDPSAQIPFSRGITGDIVLTSKVAFSLMTWVFLFKTGILPIGFTWQPHAYSEAPIPVSAGFTAIADTVGIYLFMRFFGTILGKDVIQELAEFRVMLLAFVQVLTIISAFTSALLMVAEKDAKKFITYSTISQFSLALLGFTLDNVFGVASTILLLISNTLGDATLFYLTGLSIVRCGRSVACLAALKGNNSALFSLVITVLNLFGIIPIVLGFWGKVLLVLAGLNRSVVIPVTILVVSGISAIGYFRLVHAVYTSHLTTRDDPRSKNITIPVTMVLILGVAIIVLGSCFALYEPFRGFVMEISNDLLSNYGEYVNRSIGMEIR